MIQTIVFLVVLLFPFIVYLINMALAQKDQRGRGGIAAGIPKPKEAKAPRDPRSPRARAARVRSSRVEYCGRGFAHFALGLVGSQESCRHCTYVQNEPTPIRPESNEPPEDRGPGWVPPPPAADEDREAAVREAEEIIERWKQ